jgi:hypothetical protein
MASNAANYLALQLADGAVCCWPLNESSGTVAVDYSANGLNGTYYGGVSLSQPGPAPDGSAKVASFDGVSGFVSYYPVFGNGYGEMEIEIWSSGSGVLMERWTAASGQGYNFLLTTNAVYTRSDSAGDLYLTTWTTPAAGWHHYVVSVNGDDVIR